MHQSRYVCVYVCAMHYLSTLYPNHLSNHPPPPLYPPSTISITISLPPPHTTLQLGFALPLVVPEVTASMSEPKKDVAKAALDALTAACEVIGNKVSMCVYGNMVVNTWILLWLLR